MRLQRTALCPSQSAEPLAAPGTPGAALPGSLAIVMGREADGVSQEMLAAAHKWVWWTGVA